LCSFVTCVLMLLFVLYFSWMGLHPSFLYVQVQFLEVRIIDECESLMAQTY
jgi:hypothetical protein